jgi:release factor glutamine methyltransferase
MRTKKNKPSFLVFPLRRVAPSLSLETISTWLKTNLCSSTSDTPSLDGQVLLAHILNKPRSWILAHPEAALTPVQQQDLEQAVSRLQAGEPLPYVLGHWEFFGLEFQVTPDVLIPRPETELLVEQALDWLRRHPSARNAIDVGTGSGCIAISLATHIPDLHLLATDLSFSALQIARRNAQKHSVIDRIDFVQADLLNWLNVERSTFSVVLNRNVSPPTFDLIVANLPYIPAETLLTLAVYGKEPTIALDGGQDGLDLVRRLLSQSPARLATGGLLLLEIEHRQGPPALALAQDAFLQAKVDVLKDLNGYDRILRVANQGSGFAL